MSNLDEKIFKAINIIAKRIVDKANYDKVVKGEIFIENKDEEDIYRVKVGNVFYPAAAIGGEEYHAGDIVYLLIPQNDVNNTKFILGRESDFKIKKASKEKGGIEVDDFLSLVSENPVQNKVIKKYVDDTFALKKYYQNNKITLSEQKREDVGNYSILIGDNKLKSSNAFVNGENNTLEERCDYGLILNGENNSINPSFENEDLNKIYKKNSILFSDDCKIEKSNNSNIYYSNNNSSIINSQNINLNNGDNVSIIDSNNLSLQSVDNSSITNSSNNYFQKIKDSEIENVINCSFENINDSNITESEASEFKMVYGASIGETYHSIFEGVYGCLVGRSSNNLLLNVNGFSITNQQTSYSAVINTLSGSFDNPSTRNIAINCGGIYSKNGSDLNAFFNCNDTHTENLAQANCLINNRTVTAKNLGTNNFICNNLSSTLNKSGTDILFLNNVGSSIGDENDTSTNYITNTLISTRNSHLKKNSNSSIFNCFNSNISKSDESIECFFNSIFNSNYGTIEDGAYNYIINCQYNGTITSSQLSLILNSFNASVSNSQLSSIINAGAGGVSISNSYGSMIINSYGAPSAMNNCTESIISGSGNNINNGGSTNAMVIGRYNYLNVSSNIIIDDAYDYTPSQSYDIYDETLDQYSSQFRMGSDTYVFGNQNNISDSHNYVFGERNKSANGGNYHFTFGWRNQSTAINSFILGENNRIYSHKIEERVIPGVEPEDTTTYNLETFSTNNYIIGKDNAIGTLNENDTANKNIILGIDNKITTAADGNILIGEGLVTSSNNQFIIGRYNEEISQDNIDFVLGVGADAQNRKNILSIYEDNNTNSYVMNGEELISTFKEIKTNNLINTNDDEKESFIEQKIIEIDIEKNDSNLTYLNNTNETSIKIKIAEHLIPQDADEEWNYEDYLYLPKIINFDLSKLDPTISNCFILKGNDDKVKCYNSVCTWISNESIIQDGDETITYYLEIIVPTSKLYADLGLSEIEKLKIQVKGYII